MARAPQVTRTIISTKVIAMVVNTTTCEVENKEVMLPRVYKDEKALERALHATVDDDETRFVQAVSVETVEKLYGMSEVDFIAHATELPPRPVVEKKPQSPKEEN